MEMNYNQKINFGRHDWKSYLLRHINFTMAHKNLFYWNENLTSEKLIGGTALEKCLG